MSCVKFMVSRAIRIIVWSLQHSLYRTRVFFGLPEILTRTHIKPLVTVQASNQWPASSPISHGFQAGCFQRVRTKKSRGLFFSLGELNYVFLHDRSVQIVVANKVHDGLCVFLLSCIRRATAGLSACLACILSAGKAART